MSFNATPPLPNTQNILNLPQSNLSQLSIQMPLFNMNQFQQSWLPTSTTIQPQTLLQQPHNLLLQSQFDCNKTQTQLINIQNANTLTNSFNTYQQLNRFPSNQFMNPTELSPFNTKNMTSTNLENNYFTNPFNSNGNFKNLGNLLNESFENCSLYDDSFKLSLNNTINNLQSRTNENDDDADDENFFNFNQDINEDVIEDVDEVELKFLKKNKILSKDANDLNSHHQNILKFYEEEEKILN